MASHLVKIPLGYMAQIAVAAEYADDDTSTGPCNSSKLRDPIKKCVSLDVSEHRVGIDVIEGSVLIGKWRGDLALNYVDSEWF